MSPNDVKSSQHTPEPWPEPKSISNICSPWRIYAIASFDRLEDAQRAVACVNACHDMADPVEEVKRMREQAEMFRYLCKVTHAESPPEIKDHHCFMGIDGKTHWGKTFEEAVRNAMNHDKGGLAKHTLGGGK